MLKAGKSWPHDDVAAILTRQEQAVLDKAYEIVPEEALDMLDAMVSEMYHAAKLDKISEWVDEAFLFANDQRGFSELEQVKQTWTARVTGSQENSRGEGPSPA